MACGGVPLALSLRAGLAAALASAGVWGGGPRTLASGPSGYMVPRFGSVELVGSGQPLFMGWGCGHNMTSQTLVRNAS